MPEPFAHCPIADLIMILRRHNKPPPGRLLGRSAMHTVPMARPRAGVDEHVLERTREVRERTEVFVIAQSLARDRAMQRMVEFIAPWGIDAVPPRLSSPNDTGIIQVAFGDEHQV